MGNSNRDLLADVIEKEMAIPPFPAVAQKVISEVNKPNTTAGILSELIIKDQGLTTTILKTVNSPFYGLRSKMTTINQAVAYLGMKAIRHLAIAATSKTVYQKHGIVEETMWAHSLGVALGARLISASVKFVDSDEAFLAGLMHDIGKVIMNNNESDRFAESIANAKSEGLTSCEAEDAVFGFTHTDVGSLLIQQWNLSDDLESAVYLHHDLELAQEEAEAAMPLICTINLADRICHYLGIGTDEASEEIDFDADPAAKKLGAEAVWLQELTEQTRSTYDQEKSLFLQ